MAAPLSEPRETPDRVGDTAASKARHHHHRHAILPGRHTGNPDCGTGDRTLAHAVTDQSGKQGRVLGRVHLRDQFTPDSAGSSLSPLPFYLSRPCRLPDWGTHQSGTLRNSTRPAARIRQPPTTTQCLSNQDAMTAAVARRDAACMLRNGAETALSTRSQRTRMPLTPTEGSMDSKRRSASGELAEGTTVVR